MIKSRTRSEWVSRWGFGWIPLWIYTFLVVEGAILPPDRFPEELSRFSDRVLHAGEYGLLFLIALHAFSKAGTPWLNRKRSLAAWVYGLAVGGVTEGLQHYVPGRTPEIQDFFSDAAGIGIAFLFYFFILRGIFKKRRGSE